MAKVFLRKKISNRIAMGHPWVFDSEVGDVEGDYRAGDVVNVFSSTGSFVGAGFINPKSKIFVRLVSRVMDEVIDEKFIAKKIEAALRFRKTIGSGTNTRLFYDVADGLPGLILDRFGDYIVLQTLTKGIDDRKTAIVDVLRFLCPDALIYERNDAGVRQLEGMVSVTGFLVGDGNTLAPFEQGDFNYFVDVAEGPRTGFFWEQLWIADAIRRYAAGVEVLDLFCYAGFCSLAAIASGATSVIAVDHDAAALALAARNVALNHAGERVSLVRKNVFDVVKELAKEGRRFGLVILDPPSFLTRLSQLEKALSGYRQLYLQSLSLTSAGGYLLVSCSAPLISLSMMLSLIHEVAHEKSRQWRVVHVFHQGPDHPVVFGVSGSDYFKAVLIQVF